MYKSSVKNKIMKNILLSLDRDNTIVELCKENKISINTFRNWLNEDKAYKELYEEKRKTIETEFTSEIVSKAKSELLKKVIEGHFLSIKYVLDNMYINFNSNLPEIKKIIIDNILEKLTETNLDVDAYKQVLNVVKQVETTVING